MMFESELKKGNLIISKCSHCMMVVWPPADFCNRCMRETVWEDAPLDGIILESSRKDGNYFCIAEIDNSFRIMGSVTSGTPNTGKKVRVKKCGIRNGAWYFELQVSN